VLLGLRVQPREDYGLSPAEAVFGAPIVLPNKFLQNEEISVDAIIKMFQKLCTFLLFLCPGTILVPSCRTSCQASSSPHSSSGSVGAASSHPFSHSTTAPTPSCAADHAPSPSERVPGQGYRRQQPQGLHGPGHHAWQPVSPWQIAGFAPRRSCSNQAGLISRPAGFFTFSSGASTRRSRNHFPTRQGGFCTPGTGGAITGATDAVPVLSMGNATEVGPLTSSPPGRGQSSGGPCGHLPTPLATVRPETSWVYSNDPVLHLYITAMYCQ
jgi:hypothetical protein